MYESLTKYLLEFPGNEKGMSVYAEIEWTGTKTQQLIYAEKVFEYLE